MYLRWSMSLEPFDASGHVGEWWVESGDAPSYLDGLSLHADTLYDAGTGFH